MKTPVKTRDEEDFYKDILGWIFDIF